MEAVDKSGTIDPALAADVKKAQAQALFDRMITTLLTNAFVSVSALSVSLIGRGLSRGALLWLTAAMLALAFRVAIRIYLQRSGLVERSPEKALHWMTTGAFVSGLAWAALPFSIPDFKAIGSDSGLYLMMSGLATGSVLVGLGYSRIAMAFAVPLHISAMISMPLFGGLTGSLVALNVAALMIILMRTSKVGEEVFISNVQGTLRATALANSLSDANADILRANYRLEVLANRDALTGLANRAAFNTALGSGIEAALAGDKKLALLILDLDRFKTINDTLGHSAGDALLIEISDRLRSVVGMEAGVECLIARLGGDEFAVIIGGTDAAALARVQAETILERSCRPVVLNGQPAAVGASIGLAIFPDHAETAEDLFIAADMALYRAKDQGRRQWREFEPTFRAQADRQHQIEQELAHALDIHAIEAWFQPQIALDSGKVTGFEALVRWNHPHLGPVSPPELVQAAQASNLADRLTARIAENACVLLNRLPGLGLPKATVAINVSPREFDLYNVTDVLNRITDAHAIDPALFEIEITEEAILDTAVAGEQLKRIERAGYKLAVDDFGAGHSSLAYLVTLKVDRLKIDRRFVTGIHNSRQNQEIVGALVGLGRALSMEVVVEGVETEQESAALKNLGCGIVQGYLFGRPMPADRIAGWLETRNPPTTLSVA